jgi:transcriptional regulator with XRE-family HTH domain
VFFPLVLRTQWWTLRSMDQPSDADIAKDLRMFGRNLCSARERIGLDQAVFAKLSGYDRSTISKIECGRQAPKFDTLLTLAGVAEVQPAELLDGVGVKRSSSETPSYEQPTPNTPAALFGANLKWAREQLGLSHERLGSAAGVDRSLISGWEKGELEASLRTILKLARALAVPSALLLHKVKPPQA